MNNLIIAEAEIKKCRNCGVVKPISEYYLYSRTQKHAAICKECSKIYGKKYRATKGFSRVYSEVEHERILIAELRSRGIFAVAGKQTLYAKTDVVAWGCVRIEAKLSNVKSYRIAFSRQQVERGVRAEIIAVMIPFDTGIRFYLAPANHPMFERKERISVHPAPTKPSLSIFSQLREYADNWSIIEECRLRISNELALGEVVTPGIQPAMEQPGVVPSLVQQLKLL